ncbi:hypothetical protein [Runella slithyformis]|uniref:Uncharacterized protein n=1 Tax=Runella slithyformis (strain ATCC 29530 / DSM 19594 / LMG 11500 / NCIMB 11436 / LSU 4) TaxID=761193 RepID=A0A7U4E785_RUNSL|nr:hypothetical protein [Runella slithyformis]AEI50388.1 hypothetical protein Runsl_4036 [Runella slithyformis DSM 19594]
MRTLELEDYGVMEMSEMEQLGIEGEGKLPSWKQIKTGGEWFVKEMSKLCSVNCATSWVEGFVKEMAK